MAVYDTEENGRSEFTERTLESLIATVDFDKHRLIVIDNASCEQTKEFIRDRFDVITNDTNIGTAKAVNQGLKLRQPGEHCIKMDNDIVVRQKDWVDEMIEVMERMPQLGILGLKRKDLMESPYAINTDQRTRLLEVKHELGQRWYVIEEAKQIMGSCTMFSPALLDMVGGLYQCDGLYGFDDSLMSVRSSVAGFMNAFLPHIEIDHIDPGGTDYTEWKKKYAGEMIGKYAQEEALLKSGAKDVYYPL